MQKNPAFILIFVLGGFLLSCSSQQYTAERTETTSVTPVTSKYYTSAFPNRDVSDLLNKAQDAVLRIVSTGYYQTYNFDEKYITMADARTNNLSSIATYEYSSEQSTAGTSIVLDTNRDEALVITCDHVVSFPDTVVTYHEDESLTPNTFVKSISVKNRQVDLIFGPREFHNFEVLASDPRRDLALVTTKISRRDGYNVLLQNFEMGESELIQSGSFLYILGFPKGYSSITRGIASTSEDWETRYFLTDALFNPGVSGGLVIASNNNFESFHWVGMAKSATATSEDLLVPRPNSEKYGKAIEPYSDSIFVQHKTRIVYGLTQAIPIDQIKDFLQENQTVMRRNGFDYHFAAGN
jgi:S1-C subfamily serine protease